MDESAPQPVSSPIEPPPSNPPGPFVSTSTATGNSPQPVPPLEYEETPVIAPVETNETQNVQQTAPPVSEPRKRGSGSFLKAVSIIALVAILFIGGTWLSGFVRQLFTPAAPVSTAVTPAPEQVTPVPVSTADSFVGWSTYQVTSGVTRLPFPGLSFKLPPEVLAPVCDSAGCISQGTFLPGGTRLTVALRGAGQSLRDFRGSLITDANGKALPTSKMSLGTAEAVAYDSSASGKTISGYVFSRIRGVMIPLTDTLSVEVNHFAPTGIVADFAADDTVFDTIIKTFTYSASPTVTAAPSPILPAAPSATSSGF
jgi:hypothetical protein